MSIVARLEARAAELAGKASDLQKVTQDSERSLEEVTQADKELTGVYSEHRQVMEQLKNARDNERRQELQDERDAFAVEVDTSKPRGMRLIQANRFTPVGADTSEEVMPSRDVQAQRRHILFNIPRKEWTDEERTLVRRKFKGERGVYAYIRKATKSGGLEKLDQHERAALAEYDTVTRAWATGAVTNIDADGGYLAPDEDYAEVLDIGAETGPFGAGTLGTQRTRATGRSVRITSLAPPIAMTSVAEGNTKAADSEAVTLPEQDQLPDLQRELRHFDGRASGCLRGHHGPLQSAHRDRSWAYGQQGDDSR